MNRLDSLFDRFWLSGIRKMNKKKAKLAFVKVIKNQEHPEAFVDRLTFDVQRRLETKQLGFKEMHPTTYLNNERWEDEILVPEDDKPDAFDRLTDRSWATDLIEPVITQDKYIQN